MWLHNNLNLYYIDNIFLMVPNHRQDLVEKGYINLDVWQDKVSVSFSSQFYTELHQKQ